jgi:hypothetical protein
VLTLLVSNLAQAQEFLKGDKISIIVKQLVTAENAASRDKSVNGFPDRETEGTQIDEISSGL